MDLSFHPMHELFAQLGLPDDAASIESFIQQHRPLAMNTRLCDAPFWSPSQASLIREKLAEDADWAVLIDTLNVQLRDHPAEGLPAAGQADPALDANKAELPGPA